MRKSRAHILLATMYRSQPVTDKFRREAKYAAWYDDPEDEKSPYYVKNPFRKLPPRGPRHDSLREAEKGNSTSTQLRPTRTDDDYRPTTSAERREEFGVGPEMPRQHHTTANAHSRFDRGDAVQQDFDVPRSASPSDEVDHIAKDTTVINSEKHSHSSPPAVDTAAMMTGQGDPLETTRNRDKTRRWNPFNKKDTQEDSGKDDNGKQKPHFTAMGQFRATVLNSWINVLFIASPVGIALYYAHVNPIAVFVVNFIAIIPLAAMLSYATEEIALRTGETIGGLLNASFGNAVELIVSIIALTQGQVLIVQTSLIGSMLSNLLLVMGMCFFFGGFNRVKQSFNIVVAQTASSLLALAVGSLIIPTAFHAWSEAGEVGIAPLSRAAAIMLLFVYSCYLFFQLKSHVDMYNTPSAKNEKKDMGKHTRNLKQKLRRSSKVDSGKTSPEPVSPVQREMAEKEAETPQLSIWVAIATLLFSTVLVALNAEYLVDSINSITCGGGISKTFVGLILLPIVGNAAEHATAVTVAVKDKMDLAIGVAIGSSMQIALLVLPFVVVLGWIIGNDAMTLYFDGFQIAILFVAVLLVNYLIQDGESHWLEGVLLMTLYIIIAVAAWYVRPLACCVLANRIVKVLSLKARSERLSGMMQYPGTI